MNTIINAFKQRLPRVFLAVLIALVLGLPSLGFANDAKDSSSTSTVEYVKPKEVKKGDTKPNPILPYTKSSTWSDGG